MSEPLSALAPQRPSRRQALALVGVAAALIAGSGVYRWRASKTDPKLTAFEPHPAPRALGPLRFSDEAGREVSLASFRGRVVLLNVWATWCDFEVLAVSIDAEGLPVVRAYFKQVGIKHLHPYIDSFREIGTLGATGIPLTLLIDREGREVGRKLGPATWDDPKVVQTIRGYLANPEKP